MLCESLCDFFYDFTQYKLKKTFYHHNIKNELTTFIRMFLFLFNDM